MANIEAVTKKEYTSTSGQTAYNDHGIPFLHKDDIEVWITDSASAYGAGVPVLQQTAASAADDLTNSHPQVAGTRRPALTTAIKQRGYTISSDGTDITLNAAPTTGSTVTIQRVTRDGSGKYTSFSSGGTIRASELNQAFDEVKYQVQEARNGIMGGGAGQASGDNIDAASLVGTLPAIDGSNLTGVVVGTGSITSASIADGTIVNDDINASAAIAQSKVALDITNAHINASAAISLSKLNTGSLPSGITIASANIPSGTIVADDLSSNSVTSAKIANSAVTDAKIDGMAASKLTGALPAISGANLTGITVGNNTISAAKLQTDSVETVKIKDGNVTNDKIANTTITGSKLVNDTITSTQLSANAVGSAELADNSVASANIINGTIVDADINSSAAIAQSKLALDAELTTLAGMPSGTASVLASSTPLTSTTTELNLLDGKSVVTSVSGSSNNDQLPTAKAVNDQIIAVVQEVGGFYPIDDELKFPNTNPDPSDDAGTIVSIADAGGLVVNSSGVSTTGRTLGGSTVTINGIDSSLHSTTIAAGKGMLVQTTSTLNTYTYHRLTLDEGGVAAAQTLVSDFNQRYRVGANNPSSDNDDGDLFFNTTSNKMLVYDASDSAWEEVQSIGNFYIATFSESFDGSRTAFTVSNAPTTAQQLLISINGVVQKPNAGTGQPSEGFTLNSSTVTFSSAPPSGSDSFVVVLGSTVNIGTPSNNTVSTAVLQNASVTTTKLADQAVDLTKIVHGTSSNNGKFLRSNNGADPTWEDTSIADDSIAEVKLDISNAPSDGKFLQYKDSSDKLTWAAASSAEVYGFKYNGNNLNVVTTNSGADNISNATYAGFKDVFFAASGFSWSVNASGNLIATI